MTAYFCEICVLIQSLFRNTQESPRIYASALLTDTTSIQPVFIRCRQMPKTMPWPVMKCWSSLSRASQPGTERYPLYSLIQQIVFGPLFAEIAVDE